VAHRAPPGGLPNADRVMERGLVLPSSHALADDDIDYIWEIAEAGIPPAPRNEEPDRP